MRISTRAFLPAALLAAGLAAVHPPLAAQAARRAPGIDPADMDTT